MTSSCRILVPFLQQSEHVSLPKSDTLFFPTTRNHVEFTVPSTPDRAVQVNVIALFSFAVPVSDTGDRLSLLSTTLVAVTAYQTVINQSIPQRGCKRDWTPGKDGKRWK